MIIKRPVLMMAGGFVLGEVLILLRMLTVRQMVGGQVLSLIILLIWFCKNGRSTGGFLLFFLCMTVGVFRAAWAQEVSETSRLSVQTLFTPNACGTVSQINAAKQGTSIELKHVTLWENGSTIKVRGILVTVKENDMLPSLKLGMEVMTKGKIQVFPLPRNPGEFHAKNFYDGEQLSGRMQADSFRITNTEYSRIRNGLYLFRLWGEARINKLTDGAEAGIFRAAIFGDKAGLEEETKELYGRNGISHLLALSGLHLALIVSSFYRMLRRQTGSFFIAGVAGTLLALAYVLMTGSPVSVVRSSIMLICSFLAAYCGRKYDLSAGMGLAAVFLLWHNPYFLYQAGFQLSFGAIAGIGFVLPCINCTQTGYVKQAAVTGFAIQSATLPFVLFHYYQISIYGMFLNLIVIPLMVFVIVSGLAGIFLGLLHRYLGEFAIGTGYYVLLLYEKLCVFSEWLPHAIWIFGRPKTWQLAVYGVGLMLFLIGSRYGNVRLRIAYLLVLQLTLFIQLPVLGVQVTFLDVGQGDGTFIRSGYAAILSDGGSGDIKALGKYRLEPFLKQQGVSVLDYVYVSHGDMDHINGIVYLLEEGKDIRIKNLMLPAAGRGDAVYHGLEEQAHVRGTRVHWIYAGDRRTIGGMSITCLYPDKKTKRAKINEQSLVLKVEYRDFQMLLTGDMGVGEEAMILSAMEQRKEFASVQVLKIAHHGSKHSSSKEWLSALKPRWAVVSYGAGNTYGHPHLEVLDRLKEQEITLYQTAVNGAVTLNTNGRKIQWKVYLE